MDNAYDYEYDPNLKLTTPRIQDDLKQGSGLVGDGVSEMSPEDETMPMTDEERAYLEEHYRYQNTTVRFNFSRVKSFRIEVSLYSLCLYCSQDLDDYDYLKVKLPEEAIMNDNEDLLDSSLAQELVQFSCIFNLAPLESAKLSISIYLNVR